MGATDDRFEIKVSPFAASGRALGGRPTQQDAFICFYDEDSRTHLLVLADGMGGHGAGELASGLVIETAEQLWQEGRWKEEAGAVFLEELCQRAHQRLRDSASEVAQVTPHATIVCLFVKPTFSYWAHVGDSRLYRFHGQRFLGRTDDHSVTQEKIRRGELTAEQADQDSEQNLLLQGLGGHAVPTVEHGGMPSHADHGFVLCSDGVWAHLSSDELGNYLRQDASELAVAQALELSLKRGGAQADNASLVLVRPHGSSATRRLGWRRWFPFLRQSR